MARCSGNSSDDNGKDAWQGDGSGNGRSSGAMAMVHPRSTNGGDSATSKHQRVEPMAATSGKLDPRVPPPPSLPPMVDGVAAARRPSRSFPPDSMRGEVYVGGGADGGGGRCRLRCEAMGVANGGGAVFSSFFENYLLECQVPDKKHSGKSFLSSKSFLSELLTNEPMKLILGNTILEISP